MEGGELQDFFHHHSTAGDRNGAKKCTMYSFQSSSLFVEAEKLQAKVREKSLPKPCRVYAALEFIPKRKKAEEYMVAIQPSLIKCLRNAASFF